MAQRLVGVDRAYQPQNFLATRLPGRYDPRAGMTDRQRAVSMWEGGNPYNRPIDQLGPRVAGMNPAMAGLMKSNMAQRNAIAAANKETGMNFLTGMERYAAGAPNQLGSPMAVKPMVRGQMGNGDYVAIDPGIVSRDGRIPTPDEVNYMLRDAQLVEHGLTPAQGLLGVGLAGLGFAGVPGMFLDKLPQAVQTAAKIGGVGSKIGNAVSSKGRSLGSAGVDILAGA